VEGNRYCVTTAMDTTPPRSQRPVAAPAGVFEARKRLRVLPNSTPLWWFQKVSNKDVLLVF